jgi:hypothetical protein
MAVKKAETAMKILADVDGDKRFFFQDGRVSKNLTELVDCLSNMTEEVFRHHVTSEKNDFSNWIRDVLGDESLASELNSVSNPSEASKIVMTRMAYLQMNRQSIPVVKKKSLKGSLIKKRSSN